MRRPTSDTAYLVQAAVSGLRSIYCEGFNYAKAGVHLLELHSADIVQGELDLDDETPNRPQLMKAIDTLNDRFGQGTVAVASAGVSGTKKDWAMRQHLLAPQYTTRFCDIPVAVS